MNYNTTQIIEDPNVFRPAQYRITMRKYIALIPQFIDSIEKFGEIRIHSASECNNIKFSNEATEICWILTYTYTSYVTLCPIKDPVFYK